MSKQRIVVDVPEVASITVTGPTQCGKSIVIDRIKKMLEAEFGAAVVSRDWEEERRLGSMDELDAWEKEMVAGVIWHISEPMDAADVSPNTLQPNTESQYYCEVCQRVLTAVNVAEVERGEEGSYVFVHDEIVHPSPELCDCEARKELLEIFKITSDVAGVSGPNSEDMTLTVRRVRDMAQLINQMAAD